MVQLHVIREYRPADRPAVRQVCAATAWLGAPAPDRIGDDWIWAEYWTRFFTDGQADCCWVAADNRDSRIVGYLTGTPDVRRFERYLPRLLPGMIWHVARKRLMRRREPRRAILGMLRSLARGELRLPPRTREAFPATFHFNLLPEARRLGLGSQLLATFLDRMRCLGVRGVHAQTLSVNEPARRTLRRLGFRLRATRPTRAFAHVDPRPVAVQTWVRAVEPAGAANRSTGGRAIAQS